MSRTSTTCSYQQLREHWWQAKISRVGTQARHDWRDSLESALAQRPPGGSSGSLEARVSPNRAPMDGDARRSGAGARTARARQAASYE